MRLLSFLFLTTVYASTYNSFRQQMGFCKLQGFDTVSRSTSGGSTLLLDGRVVMGVGLSNAEFQDSITSCGRCLNISAIDNLAPLSFELDSLVDTEHAVTRPPFLVMVMDQCTDPICTSGFLDFDVYLPDPPVFHGNPGPAIWSFVPCPGPPDRTLLLCLSAACNAEASDERSVAQVIQESSPYYWSLYPRFPVSSVHLPEYNIDLVDENGWSYHGEAMDLNQPFLLCINGVEIWTVHLLDYKTQPGYHGGILLSIESKREDLKKKRKIK